MVYLIVTTDNAKSTTFTLSLTYSDGSSESGNLVVQAKDILDKLKNAEKQEFSIDLTENLLTINAAFQTNDEV